MDIGLRAYAQPLQLYETFVPYQGPAHIDKLYELLAEEDSGQQLLKQKQLNRFSKRDRIRALLTVRPAGKVSQELADLNDAILQEELKQKVVTDSRELDSFACAGRSISIWQGDITQLKVDAIVNAANSQLLGCFIPFHTCIDYAIHDAAGVQLRRDCDIIITRQGHPEKTGEAKITRGYNLPASFVIHTVGPIVRGTLRDTERQQLRASYTSCLDLAEEMHLKSIALCAISTGVFGFPKYEAADIAKETIQMWLHEHPKSSLQHVIMNAFDEETQRLYEEVWT